MNIWSISGINLSAVALATADPAQRNLSDTFE
jgi:hypothetical protein